MAVRIDYLCFGILAAIVITSVPTLAERKDSTQASTKSDASKLIADEEGFRSCPYKDPVGVPTIGYGATSYSDGRAVNLSDPCITKEDAKKLMAHHISKAGNEVARLVKVPLSANQKTALTSFAYNFGSGALASSALLSKLNAGDKSGAASEFDRWIHADGKPLLGLVDRRAKEKALFKK